MATIVGQSTEKDANFTGSPGLVNGSRTKVRLVAPLLVVKLAGFVKSEGVAVLRSTT